jgi:anaerobic selenocysteine-containing dehydrogenase
MTTFRGTCKIGACEPFCGLEFRVEDGVLVDVQPDKQHPITKGYVCIKGMHVADYQNDPDRLLHPVRRSDKGWAQISWETATGEIGKKLRALRDSYGPTSIATYWGNACDSATITLTNTFCSALGSPNSFNVLSLEYTDRGAVAKRVLGNENFILQPDAGNSSFALLLGTNPLVTQGMTLLQRRPHIMGDIQAIRRRGGKVVVVDPRRTETVKVADEHVPIRPGTDLFLLVGMIKHILETKLYDHDFVVKYTVGLETWEKMIKDVDLEQIAKVTDVPATVIKRLAEEFAEAESGFVTTRVGVQTSHNSSLTEWAVMTLNAITGNIDRPGGVYFNPGAVNVPALIEQFTKGKNAAPSRIGNYPQIFGGPPASVFADDVLSDDPARIRALIVVGGNPVITFPNTRKMEEALRRLELLVTVDLYLSDTGSFGHYNLPAATMFEKGSFHFLTSNFEPYPFAEWKPKMVEPRGEARSEWDIFRDLSRASGVPFLNHRLLDKVDKLLGLFGSGFTLEHLSQYLLLGKTSLRRLKAKAGGIKFADIHWGEFLAKGLQTNNRKIHLAPDDFIQALPNALAQPPVPSTEFPMLLISGGRRLASYNSWTHNIPALMDKLEGNWATLNPNDAARLGIAEGDLINISSATGSLEITARISADIREGVVMIHQFWGHVYESGTRTSRKQPGVNVNHLHSDQVLDRFSGMPVFNGTACRIESVDARRGRVEHSAEQ